jgi:pimeloyl-ACP methyl ester carboxylesterase
VNDRRWRARRGFCLVAPLSSDLEGAALPGFEQSSSGGPKRLQYSPLGLAAWIVEKFPAWSDCDGAVEQVFTLDELLTDISLYWFSDAVDSPLRIYKANRLEPLRFAPGEHVEPPLAVASFPRELPMPPRSWVERCFNVVRWTKIPRGGHFAAMEQPALLAEDIRSFFRPLRG